MVSRLGCVTDSHEGDGEIGPPLSETRERLEFCYGQVTTEHFAKGFEKSVADAIEDN